MRICRYEHHNQVSVGFYFDTFVVPLADATREFNAAGNARKELAEVDDLLDFLPPDGTQFETTKQLARWVSENLESLPAAAKVSVDDVQLLVPIPRPNKLFLLAGNYAKHIEEGGGIAAERVETFPYVFMKPPSTTLTHPNLAVHIPSVSPGAIDWELELAVIIGRKAKGVSEADALDYVAGYTIINDVSDRKFRPNPSRKQRDKDGFFDWLHGKWHDSFCPCGPCVLSADDVDDPQTFELKLCVNGTVHQDASTAQQVFPVAAVIEFISSFVTLEPGDIISTGTPQGVGNTTGTYLKTADQIEASISSIGTLVSPVE